MKKKQQKDPKDMKRGYTTGANATAATKAALLSLMLQQEVKEVKIPLPIGEVIPFQMEKVTFSTERAEASVIKDAGDDPDATHQAKIVASVTWRGEPGITIDGGVGVGRVTKPGLPVPVGEAAINPVPRKMIREAAESVLAESETQKGIQITISVPDGEEIAEKTLNARLGIIGGISILGTRGIVVPFSTAAYKASVVQAIKVAKESGCDHLFLTTGGRSEKYAMALYEGHQEEAFIEMGDFVGFALKQCKAQKITKVTLVGMMGKFSKVAQGIMMVHSKSAPVDFNFLADLAKEVGAEEGLLEEIRSANTASQVGTMMQENGYDDFFAKLCIAASRSGLAEVGGGLEIETILMTMKQEVLGRETVTCESLSK
ncbi:cobalt-precorrin-5B (C(1))-methyltransferase [Desertibacillus haloalkaliphilus]|uniref:cobalt-precorrin-5B (C(1))-methyltransferase n=1 Tax=Desertibacillus haloalkaliphilus TaxID=1328930 RepID=UPI001C25DBBA|nr:cobalt-precorrin-5B (C(1))-methyltransferase [Desertibacillus haloalkaliphilus]MBU8907811.1 cobalt-precorrin-5B (C(1))-methyltransferase [Desertibacillus haloalkaliphilus]